MNYCCGFDCVHIRDCIELEISLEVENWSCDNVDCENYGCNSCSFVNCDTCPGIKSKK